MAKPRHRPPLAGPSLIRLLAGFAEDAAPINSPDLSDRLSQWLDWTRAVALSRALEGRLPSPPEGVRGFDAEVEAECAQLRARLAEAIAQPPAPLRAGTAADDFAPHRQRCLSLQRSIQANTGQLRGRLRDMLSHTAGDGPRLAEVDAVLEQTLSPREQALLAKVPALLATHFERLCAPTPAEAAADSAAPTAASDGLPRFQRDMQATLLAELDVRFQPIDGLLAALRSH